MLLTPVLFKGHPYFVFLPGFTPGVFGLRSVYRLTETP